jgi:uncharacterized protein (DUF488 family)
VIVILQQHFYTITLEYSKLKLKYSLTKTIIFMSKEPKTIYTIGHSTLPLNDFIEILKSRSITLLCDIRTVTRSRHNPQFNKETLQDELKKIAIQYVHLAGLGGFRTASKTSVNSAWINSSFRGFADYMQTDEFEESLNELIRYGKKENTTIMCAEGNPFRCHRLLVADALTARQIRVLHIYSKKSVKEHVITSFAKILVGKVTYPG